MMKRTLATLSSAALLVALSTSVRAGDGDPVSFKFSKPAINSMGVMSLEELRGKPVLIDFWGHNCGPCIGFAVPSAIKLQKEYGDAIQVIFVESQGATREQFEAFAWNYKWMGSNAMWTEERPVQSKSTSLPESCLIGCDGQIIMQGNPGDLGSKLEDAIAAEVKKSKEAPAGTPAALKKAWTLFAKGNLAGALAECDKVGTDEAKGAREQFLSMAKKRVDRAKWLVDNGYVIEAEKLTTALATEVKGCADLEPLVAAQAARISAPDLAAEREASKSVASFLEQVANGKKKPFEPANLQRAESLSKKHTGTKAAERAAHFASLAQVKPAP